VQDQMHRYLNGGSALPASAPVGPIATDQDGGRQRLYLKRLICVLLDNGQHELCHKYLEGAPAGGPPHPPTQTPLPLTINCARLH